MTTPASDAVHAANRRLHDQANAEQRAAEFDWWVEQAMRLAEHTAKAMRRIDGGSTRNPQGASRDG